MRSVGPALVEEEDQGICHAFFPPEETLIIFVTAQL